MPLTSRLALLGLAAAAALTSAAPLTTSSSGRLFTRDFCFFSCPASDLIPVILPPPGYSQATCPSSSTENLLSGGVTEIQSTPPIKRSLAVPSSPSPSRRDLAARGPIELCSQVAYMTFPAVLGYAFVTQRMTLEGGANYAFSVAATQVIHSIVAYAPRPGGGAGDVALQTFNPNADQQLGQMMFYQTATIEDVRFIVNFAERQATGSVGMFRFVS